MPTITVIDPSIRFVKDPSVEYPLIENVIHKLSWRFSQTYPITYEECRSEACCAFLRACQDYQAKRGQKFSTWVYYWVWCKLKDLVIMRSKEPVDFMEINDEALGEAPPQTSESLDVVKGLSQDARDIISMLLETPKELVGVATTPNRFLNRVKDHMVMKKGKDRKHLDAAVKEITVALRTSWGQAA